MDDICAWLRKLARWCDQSAIPPIPYAGFSPVGMYNPPAKHIELVYLGSGQIDDLKIGDQNVCLPAGSLSLHSVHFGNFSKRFRTDLDSWCLFLDVTGIEEFECLDHTPLFTLMAIRQADRIVALFEKISTLCLLSGRGVSYVEPTPAYDPEQRNTSGRLRMKGAVLELLAALIEEASFDTGEPLDLPPTSAVGEATAFMARTYMAPDLCLMDIAESASVHPDHLGRLFRQQLGLTPMQYLKRLRINRATVLLRQSNLPIGEVAGKVGFADPLHFSRVFRQQTGLCARDYRQQG